MTPNEEFTIKLVLAQLRHAYSHLMREEGSDWDVDRRKEFAIGLIHPQIARLELLVDAAPETPIRTISPTARDFVKNPYTPDEARVLEYWLKYVQVGDTSEVADPIGELIEDHKRSIERR